MTDTPTPTGEPTWPSELGELVPVEVFDSYGGLLLSYSAYTAGQRLVLVSLCGDLQEQEQLRYFITAMAPSVLSDLRAGRMTARQGITSGWMWLAYKAKGGSWLQASEVQPEDVEEYLPAPHSMFTHDLEPAFALKATGPDISASNVPASVITKTVESARMALKALVDHTLEASGSGRPTQNNSSFYDLPVCSTAFASFQVSFSAAPRPQPPVSGGQLFIPQIMPEDTQSTDTPSEEERYEIATEAIWSLLTEGIGRALSGNLTEEGWENEGDYRAVLEALQHLTPPQNGHIHCFEISGASLDLGAEHVTLNRAVSRDVQQKLKALKQQQGERAELYVGTIRQLDLDDLSFTLRHIEKHPMVQLLCVADEGLRDKVKEALDLSEESKKYIVAGTRQANKPLKVTTLLPYPEDQGASGPHP